MGQSRITRKGLAIAAVFCTLAAIVLWAGSIPQIDVPKLNDLGLLSVLPNGFWLAIALLALAFGLNLGAKPLNGPVAGSILLVLVLFLHATPAIAYGTLRYSWAWKHLGVVDYILRYRALDPTAEFLGAYHNWPAFFVIAAETARLANTDALGLVDIARFFPTAINISFVLLLPVLLGRFTTDSRLIWTATGIFVVGNWVGQDYFSPQAFAFLLYLTAVTICLGFLHEENGTRSYLPDSITQTWRRFDRWACSGMPQGPQAPRMFRIGASVLFMMLVVAITAMHQLTPMVFFCTLAGLHLLGRIDLGYVIFAGLMEMLWLFFYADPFVASIFPDIVAEFGRTADSALDKMADLSRVSAGQVWVSGAARGLTVAVTILAILGGLRRLLHDLRDGPAAVLVLAPLPLLIATSYGGEIIFRLYFFALPALSFFAAALFFPTQRHGTLWWSPTLAAVLLGTLAPAFILANNGKDRQYYFTRSEVEAATWLYRNAPPNSLLIEGSRSYPSQFLNYENFAYVPISEESSSEQIEIISDAAGVLGRWLEQAEGGGFVIITRSQKAGVDDLGIMPHGALTAIEDQLIASPRFVVAYGNEDVTVFKLHSRSDLLGPWSN